MQFGFQKFLWHFSAPIAAVAVACILFYAVYTDMNIEEIGNTAPFAKTLQSHQPDMTGFKALPIDQPNLTPREMGEWVNIVVSEALTLSPDTYDADLARLKPYFTDEGYNQFVAYLGEAKMFDALSASALKTNVVVEAPPLMLNEGNTGGVYRWLYDVPVAISYIPKAATAYSKQTNVDVVRGTVRLQMGRILKEDEPEAVRVESWRVTARTK